MDEPPRKRGRRATGTDPMISLRVPQDWFDRIERFAEGYSGMTRSAAIRCLIDMGLKVPVKQRQRLYDPRGYDVKRRLRSDPDTRLKSFKYNPTLEQKERMARGADVLLSEPGLPAVQEPGRAQPKSRGLTREQIKAMADRAERRRQK